MMQIGLKIFLSRHIYDNECAYMYGKFREVIVNFVFLNVKTNKSTCRHMIYKQALALAHDRAKDGRYKNYEFLIHE